MSCSFSRGWCKTTSKVNVVNADSACFCLEFAWPMLGPIGSLMSEGRKKMRKPAFLAQQQGCMPHEFQYYNEAMTRTSRSAPLSLSRKCERRIILPSDTCGRRVWEKAGRLKGTPVVRFPANSTSVTHSLDQGIVKQDASYHKSATIQEQRPPDFLIPIPDGWTYFAFTWRNVTPKQHSYLFCEYTGFERSTKLEDP